MNDREGEFEVAFVSPAKKGNDLQSNVGDQSGVNLFTRLGDVVEPRRHAVELERDAHGACCVDAHDAGRFLSTTLIDK